VRLEREGTCARSSRSGEAPAHPQRQAFLARKRGGSLRRDWTTASGQKGSTAASSFLRGKTRVGRRASDAGGKERFSDLTSRGGLKEGETERSQKRTHRPNAADARQSDGLLRPRDCPVFAQGGALSQGKEGTEREKGRIRLQRDKKKGGGTLHRRHGRKEFDMSRGGTAPGELSLLGRVLGPVQRRSAIFVAIDCNQPSKAGGRISAGSVTCAREHKGGRSGKEGKE